MLAHTFFMPLVDTTKPAMTVLQPSAKCVKLSGAERFGHTARGIEKWESLMKILKALLLVGAVFAATSSGAWAEAKKLVVGVSLS